MGKIHSMVCDEGNICTGVDQIWCTYFFNFPKTPWNAFSSEETFFLNWELYTQMNFFKMDSHVVGVLSSKFHFHPIKCLIGVWVKSWPINTFHKSIITIFFPLNNSLFNIYIFFNFYLDNWVSFFCKFAIKGYKYKCTFTFWTIFK